MAITLPSITIQDDIKAQRILVAFNSDPSEFRQWLRSALLDEVLRREAAAIREDANSQINTARDGLATTFDN